MSPHGFHPGDSRGPSRVGSRVVRLLHVTNGEIVAQSLELAALPGRVLAWDDVLHEGPVPHGLPAARLNEVRARFAAERGWAAFEDALARLDGRDRILAGLKREEEVVLWLEPDLFDQLQLLQVVERLATAGNTHGLALVCPGDYLGPLEPGELAALLPQRESLGPALVELACRAWSAFRSPDPTAIEALLVEGTADFPYLGPALVRHLEQFPSVAEGLSRTERRILELVSEGMEDPAELFTASQQGEEYPFMGDAIFFGYLRGLDAGGALLLRGAAEPTERGRALLAAELDWPGLAPFDRWLGGVHLEGPRPSWRWDPERRRLVRSGGETRAP